MSFSYVVLLSLVCVVLYGFMKEISFKYYAIYGLMLITYLLFKNNAIIDFLFDNLNKQNFYFIYSTYNWLVQIMYYTFYLLFCFYLLNLHKNNDKLTTRIKLIFKIVIGISLALTAYAYVKDNRTILWSFFIYVYFPIIIILAIITVSKGIKSSGPMKYYLLSGSIVYITFALIALFDSVNKITEHPLIFYTIGIIIENLFFGLGLALKFKLINDEKNRQETKAILLESANEIAALKGVMEGEEKERNRIASDLHDSIGSLLTATKLELLTARKEHTNSVSLESASKIVNTTSEEVRRIAHNMRPATLEKIGLIAALREICESITQKGELQCLFTSSHEEIHISEFQSTNLYRVVQEIFSNTIKHAQATILRLDITITDNICTLEIKNNGIIFNPENINATGMGLKNIQQRVKILNGDITYSDESDIMYTTILFPVNS